MPLRRGNQQVSGAEGGCVGYARGPLRRVRCHDKPVRHLHRHFRNATHGTTSILDAFGSGQQCPDPGSDYVALGGLEALASATAHQFLTDIDTSGVQQRSSQLAAISRTAALPVKRTQARAALRSGCSTAISCGGGRTGRPKVSRNLRPGSKSLLHPSQQGHRRWEGHEVSEILKSAYNTLRGIQDLSLNGTLPGQCIPDTTTACTANMKSPPWTLSGN
jgi:hypothetical protein